MDRQFTEESPGGAYKRTTLAAHLTVNDNAESARTGPGDRRT